MNFAYLHLSVNHLPVVGTGLALLLVAYAVFRRNDGFLRAGLMVVVLSGLAAVAAVQSGERAEVEVEELTGVNEEVLHTHEEHAELAQWVALTNAALAALLLVALLRARRGSAPLRLLKGLLLVGTVLALMAMLRAAQSGGRIRHPEVDKGLFGNDRLTQTGKAPDGSTAEPQSREPRGPRPTAQSLR